MLIDFHTHFFPDTIAKKSMEALSARAGGVGFYGDGTLAGLLSFMEKDGVDVSVNLPVATQPEQVVSINRKMVELNAKSKKVVCFGAMHPDFAGFEDEIARLAQNGIKGIKLHPEYQDFYPQDKRFFPLYKACARHNIMIVFHAGADLGYPDIHCTPERVQDLLSIPGLTLILAHMGSYQLWDDVEKHLVGKNCYFDLAYCMAMNDKQLRRMILAHGSDKILLASDFPWARVYDIKKKIDSLGLDKSDLENIFYGNAKRLLQFP